MNNMHAHYENIYKYLGQIKAGTNWTILHFNVNIPKILDCENMLGLRVQILYIFITLLALCVEEG